LGLVSLRNQTQSAFLLLLVCLRKPFALLSRLINNNNNNNNDNNNNNNNNNLNNLNSTFSEDIQNRFTYDQILKK